MVEAQANITDVATTVGISPAEQKIIQAYVDLCSDRIKAAPAEILTAEAETCIRKKFPNNDKAIETVEQTAIYDESLKFVEDSAFGFPVGNLRKASPIEKAKRDFAIAAQRVASSPADPEREISYAKALRWRAKMKGQQGFKDVLGPVFDVFHHARRGYQYIAPDQTVSAVAVDDTISNLMS